MSSSSVFNRTANNQHLRVDDDSDGGYGTDDGDKASTGPLRAADVQRQMRWAEAAVDHVRDTDCTRAAAFATVRECHDLQRVARDRMSVYVADPTPRGKLRAILPDAGLDGGGEEPEGVGGADGVVALDPYPEASFGHLVVVFYVHVGATKAYCSSRDGRYLGK